MYSGKDLVASLLRARARLAEAADLQAAQAVACESRLRVPPAREELWTEVVLDSADREYGAPALYGDGYRYGESGLVYGHPAPNSGVFYPAPAGLVEAPSLSNRLADASATLVDGVDYAVVDGRFRFVVDPAASGAFEATDVDGSPAVRLWACRARFDRDDLWYRWGFPLGMRLPPVEASRDLLNAVYDAIVQGSTTRSILAAVAAAFGAPFSAAAETVEAVARDRASLWVVTDRAAYRAHGEAVAVVAAGDAVLPLTALTDAAQYHEFRGGSLPGWLTGVTLDAGFFPAGVGGLTFPNRAVATEVTTEAGYTRIEWPLDGDPAAVGRFWDAVHAGGVAAGTTLAMLLDTRTVKSGQPTAAALPAEVNPLAFLAANALGSAWVLRVRPKAVPPDRRALAQKFMSQLRTLIPPQTALILAVAFDAAADEVRLSDTDSAEEVGFYAPLTIAEELGSELVDEAVALTRRSYAC